MYIFVYMCVHDCVYVYIRGVCIFCICRLVTWDYLCDCILKGYGYDAGLRVGDRLVSVGGVDATKMNVEQVSNLMEYNTVSYYTILYNATLYYTEQIYRFLFLIVPHLLFSYYLYSHSFLFNFPLFFSTVP